MRKEEQDIKKKNPYLLFFTYLPIPLLTELKKQDP